MSVHNARERTRCCELGVEAVWVHLKTSNKIRVEQTDPNSPTDISAVILVG